MTQANISVGGDGLFLLSGDLLFSTVGGLLEQAAPMLAKTQDAVVDLSAVRNCDSAGLALLLEWVMVAKRSGTGIRYRNLPQALIGIARLSNADSLLPITE